MKSEQIVVFGNWLLTRYKGFPMLKRFPLKLVVLVVFLGAIIGSALGQVISLIIPEGVVREFFVRSISAGVTPATLDLSLFSITLGFMIKLNVIGVIGVGLAAYFLRWYK